MSNAREIADAGHTLKAWVNFDGTNAFSPNPSSSAIRASLNVDSITDNGTGDFTINLASGVMPDGDYCAVAGAGQTSGPGVLILERHDANIRTATQFRIYSTNESFSVTDPVFANVAFFR